MTAPTTEASSPGSKPRAPRRALDDLSLTIDLDALAAASAGDPDWLVADRRAGYDAWGALPAESNQLYTPYIDLRAASLGTARLVASAATAARPIALPADADGLIEITDGDVTGVALSSDAVAAGVRLTTIDELIASDPAAARGMLDGAPVLPAQDKFAQMTRALWSQGIVLDVPAASAWRDPSSSAGSSPATTAPC